MKIYRDFGTCRVEIDLTEGELVQAHREYQRLADIEDIMSVPDMCGGDAEFERDYGFSPEKLEIIAEEAAERYRDLVYERESDWLSCAGDAIVDMAIKRGLVKVEG